MSQCYENCYISNETISLKKIYTDGTIELICREVDSLMIQINGDLANTANTYSTNDEKSKHESIFLLKIQRNTSEPLQQTVYIVSSTNQIDCILFE